MERSGSSKDKTWQPAFLKGFHFYFVNVFSKAPWHTSYSGEVYFCNSIKGRKLVSPAGLHTDTCQQPQRLTHQQTNTSWNEPGENASIWEIAPLNISLSVSNQQPAAVNLSGKKNLIFTPCREAVMLLACLLEDYTLRSNSQLIWCKLVRSSQHGATFQNHENDIVFWSGFSVQVSTA